MAYQESVLETPRSAPTRETASTSQPTGPIASQTSSHTLSAIAQSGMSQSLGLISVDGKNPWILDSGATHLTGFSEHFVSYTPCAGNEKIRIADGSLGSIAGKGQIVLFDGFSLQNVLHVAKLSYDLLSISKITRELHCKATFLPESVCFQDLSLGRMIGTARHSRRLYILDDDTFRSSISRISLLSSYFSTSEHDFMLWHFRLGHPNFTYMKCLFPHLFPKIDVSLLSCDVCIWAKQHRVSFPSQLYKPTQPFTLIHSDVWGPSKVTTTSGKWWFITFIDDHTCLTWVYLITDKSEVSSIFQNFYDTIETQFHKKIAILRSDNGLEFQNHNLSEFLTSKGIVHQNSCAYTPQQNGVASKKTITFWKMPSRILHLQTPLECLKESYSSTHLVSEVPLRVFGCTTYVHNFGPNQTNFTLRTQACVFVRRNLRKEVGSPTSQLSTPVQDSELPRDQGKENPTEPCTNNTMSENDKFDVYVIENVEEKDSGDETEVKTETSNNEAERGHIGKIDKYDPSLDLPIALRKGTRSGTKHSISNYVSYENLSPQFRTFTASLDSTTIPKNIHITLECPEWKNAVMEETKALEKNNTWEICTLPEGHKPVGCKWVFTLKYKADGVLDRHKARLVAKRFTQTYDVDYSEIFFPVAKLNTTKVLSVAVNKDWPLYQLDVKNVFLNGDLVEEVYMTPRLALKPSLVNRFVNSRNPYMTEISQLKQIMGNEYEIKDLRNLKYFLRMEVARSKKGISVSQIKYTLDLLTKIEKQTERPLSKAYTDSDWARSVVDRKSTSGYCTFFWGNLVTWRSKKQSVVARSSAEAEYRAMSLGICEEIWLQKVLSDLHQESKICNNLALAVSMLGVSEALALGQSLGISAKTLTKVFNSSSARCWSSESYNPVPGVMEEVPSARDYDGGFATKLMVKDLNLAKASASEVGLQHPLTSQGLEM
ncbi:Beta-galactosidase [Cucumis melo var. makuwa]|uniref:3-hydroxyisobutyrate dehydrogenase n=1 Tax=Cucumis melo var. makuwa TaxID=1194695 RepID=A0A5D3C565_CUCMM|nr:Beta-galactosidase [Cucumis melo var. makuwa]